MDTKRHDLISALASGEYWTRNDYTAVDRDCAAMLSRPEYARARAALAALNDELPKAHSVIELPDGRTVSFYSVR